MRYALLLAALALLIPACGAQDGDGSSAPSSTPPVKEGTVDPEIPETPEPPPDDTPVDPGPAPKTQTVVLEVEGMT